MAAAILSPHLDDAVLSCWHLLAGPADVTVINVFAGVPASAGADAWWDRLTGATDSRQRMHERVEEDRRALALAGRVPVNLDFLDHQYREAEQPLSPIVAQIEGLLAPGTHVYAPAALDDHADHALVRAAALELGQTGCPVSLYADLPHGTLHGWPAWVTGAEPDPHVDVELDAAARARKLAAVRAYATQLQGLAQLAGRPLHDRETLRYEVLWRLPGAARSSLAHAQRRAVHRR